MLKSLVKFWKWYWQNPNTVPEPYCVICNSIENNPEDWVDSNKTRSAYYNGGKYYSSGSLVHLELDVEIHNVTDYQSLGKYATRNGHVLPINKGRLTAAIVYWTNYQKQKVVDAAYAELNRLEQDANTLHLAKLQEYRRIIAIEDAKEIDAKINQA